VRIGSQFYLQKLGIPQGSVLSPLLCSVFFGHVDRHFFDPLLQQPATAGVLDKELLEVEAQQVLPLLQSGKKKIATPSLSQSTPAMSKATSLFSGGNGSILLRLVDDSLFISTSQADVARFVQIMHQGFEDYGCHANRHKTTVSFNLQLSKEQENFSRNIYMSEDGASFMAWSGLLINCCTLEIQADYTRYVGEPIKGSLTVVRRTNPGSQIPIKLCYFLRAKCHPLLYDQRINSPSTVRLNAYQAFVLCAMKFHAYLCSMPHIPPSPSSSIPTPSYHSCF
jgi:telomerase reverse transcriptase